MENHKIFKPIPRRLMRYHQSDDVTVWLTRCLSTGIYYFTCQYANKYKGKNIALVNYTTQNEVEAFVTFALIKSSIQEKIFKCELVDTSAKENYPKLRRC